MGKVLDLQAARRARLERSASKPKPKVLLECTQSGTIWAFFASTDMALTPADARRLAGGLLMMADHAEGRGA